MLPGICEAKNCRLPDIIDINMGCPVPKVVGNGCGSALMKNTKLAAEIVAAAVKAAEKIIAADVSAGVLSNANSESRPLPVSAKIRSGWDEKSINAVEFSRALEAAGASFITVHPRTRTQLYGGAADYEIIQKVKSALNIPVIGSGDIKTPEDAKTMYDTTGCDLVMVGRGSYGRPWLFSQIAEFLETGAYSPDPDVSERAAIMLRQVRYAVHEKGEHAAIREARQKCAFYVRGLPNAAELRRRCGRLSTIADVEELAELF
jgi:nifR3 family TIM-barrel protein